MTDKEMEDAILAIIMENDRQHINKPIQPQVNKSGVNTKTLELQVLGDIRKQYQKVLRELRKQKKIRPITYEDRKIGYYYRRTTDYILGPNVKIT